MNNFVFTEVDGILDIDAKIDKSSKELLSLMESNPSKCLPVSSIGDDFIQYNTKKSIGLDDWLKKGNKLSKKQIEKFIYCIDACLSSIEDRNISENSICLNFHAVRVREENPFDFYFTIIPNLNSDFSYELSKLLIRLLRHVDVNNKEALALAYKLFVESSKDNYTINNLLEAVESKLSVEEQANLDLLGDFEND